MTAALLKPMSGRILKDEVIRYPPSDDGGPIEARWVSEIMREILSAIRRLMTAALLKPGKGVSTLPFAVAYPPSDDGGPIEARRSLES